MIFNIGKKESQIQLMGIILISMYIYAYHLIPLQDYPDWIYQGFLFKKILLNQVDGMISIRHYIPPNSTVTLFIGFLSFFMIPLYSGKFFLLISTIVSFIGMGKFLTYSNKNTILTNYLIAFVFTFNFNYFHGNINFIFGIGLAFYLLTIVLKKENLFLIYLLGNPLLYLTHFFPFFLFNAYIFLYFLYKKEFNNSIKIILFNIPILCVFVHYIIMKDIPDIAITNEIYNFLSIIKSRISIYVMYFMPIPLASGIHDGYLIKIILSYLNYVFVLGYGIIFILFAYYYKTIQNKFHFYFVIFLVTLFLLLPMHMSGIVRPGERLLLFAAILILSECLSLHTCNKIILVLFSVIFIFQFIYINYMTYDYNNKYASIYTDSKSQKLYYSVHRVFSRKVYYNAIDNNDTNLTFFTTGFLYKKNNDLNSF